MNFMTHTERAMFKHIAEKRTGRFIDSFETSEFLNKTICNEDGRTLLGEAVAKGAEDIMLYLLKDEKLKEMEDKNGKLFFFYLNMPKNKKMLMAKLAKAGVDFSKCASDGRSVLHSFAPLDNGEMFSRLESLGADKNKKSKIGESPLDMAKRYNNVNIINMKDSPNSYFK